MSVEPTSRSGDEIAMPAPGVADPLGDLPRLTRAGETLRRRLDGAGGASSLIALLFPDLATEVGTPEILPRASGLNRSAVVVQLAWPRLDARVGLGLEAPLAHAVVDGLLGFTRLPGEAHRQVTPVEWGVLGFVVARALDRLDARPGPLGPWDLSIDRVSPDPFDPRDLGPVVTCRWPIRIGKAAGSARLWAPEFVASRLDEALPPPLEARPTHASLASTWRAEAGSITLARGLSRLKKGGVLPIDGASLAGTVASPTGPVALACRGRDGRSRFEAEVKANSAGARLTIASRLHREATPREPAPVNPTTASPAPSAPADVPVTLVVELGRVNLTLARLADLKPGDVVELGRHSREPVELTSNGRLVARGELVQIDTELGVRVTNVFL